MRWIGYAKVEPFGEERADMRMAILACVVARVAGNKRAQPSDFIPEFGPPKKQSADQMKAVAKQFAMMYNKKKKG